MSFFSVSRLAKFDVKWAGNHQGNEHFYKLEHSNPYYELMMVAEGPIYLQVEDRRLRLISGDLYILEPWERHSGWKQTHEQANFFWIQFSCTPSLRAVPDLDRGLEPFSHLQYQDLRIDHEDHTDELLLPSHYHFKSRYELLSMFEKMVHIMTQMDGYFRFRASVLFSQIIEFIAVSLLSENEDVYQVPESFISYRKLVSLLNEVYAQNLPKSEIEKFIGRSYEYLCQIFKKYSGTTIVKYIHALKIQRAKFLLKNSSKSIQEIAQEVGIEDAFYFSKLFKKYENMNPTEYRNQRF